MWSVVAVVLDDYLKVPLYTHNGRENRRNGVQEGISEFLRWTRQGCKHIRQRGIYNIHAGKHSPGKESERRAEAGFLHTRADKVTDLLIRGKTRPFHVISGCLSGVISSHYYLTISLSNQLTCV